MAYFWFLRAEPDEREDSDRDESTMVSMSAEMTEISIHTAQNHAGFTQNISNPLSLKFVDLDDSSDEIKEVKIFISIHFHKKISRGAKKSLRREISAKEAFWKQLFSKCLGSNPFSPKTLKFVGTYILLFCFTPSSLV